MTKYYFPISDIIPSGTKTGVWHDGIGLIPRLWDFSMFDWAELGAHHRMHIHFSAGDPALKSCNLELALDAESLESAVNRLRYLHAMLYVHGVAPFSVQLITNYSINDYAGIGSRRTTFLAQTLPKGMRDGITTRTATVEIWGPPYSATPHITGKLSRRLDPATFTSVIEATGKWSNICSRYPTCKLFTDVLIAAPSMPSAGQSLLHMWTGLEALFPNVQTELSFRLALYLAQLQKVNGNRAMFFERARLSYRDRSAVAHGGQPKKKGKRDPWLATWLIMAETVQAIIKRDGVPSEENLVKELLGVPR
jgi:hypothetical protein